MAKTVRIGGASGYWGDTAIGPEQLVHDGQVDYLIFDYLAETTMSILAKAFARDPDSGYATDFIGRAMRPMLQEISRRGIKVVANAGGVNLEACRKALEAVALEAGLTLRIGTVEGDNLLPRAKELGDVIETSSGEPLPEEPMSINAYLGAFPIAAALDAGADVVITGRCVDSALALGPLIHEFGWRRNDYDHLSAGSLVGHVIECGAQATGGNFSDWEEIVEGWGDTGFPIAEVSDNGEFVLTKPQGTGGAVTLFTTGEQMLYEIGDPTAYLLPDVTCDFSAVTMAQVGANRVRVAGARGRAPGVCYKVSATHRTGFGCTGIRVVVGREAAKKARYYGEAILNKTRDMLDRAELGDYGATALQVVGAECLYGAQARPEAEASREVVLRLAIQHPSREGADLFSKEFMGAALSMAPGLTRLAPGRPKPTPVVELFSFLIDKVQVPVTVKLDGKKVPLAQSVTRGNGDNESRVIGVTPAPEIQGETTEVPLYRLAVARSGDKGDNANIGVIARRPEYLPVLRATLTRQRIEEVFSHFIKGHVERFDVPGIHAMNFLLHESLGGGGAASLNLDPQGKTYAQQLLDQPIRIPDAWRGTLPR